MYIATVEKRPTEHLMKQNRLQYIEYVRATDLLDVLAKIARLFIIAPIVLLR